MFQQKFDLGPDMKFGWKPEVDFTSAPIPLYFNFLENQWQEYYREISYKENVRLGGFQGLSPTMKKINKFQSHQPRVYPRIVYNGFRPKDSFEMHKKFIKEDQTTYQFQFPQIIGLAGAKAFYDELFEEMLDGEAPQQQELREFIGKNPDLTDDELQFSSDFEGGNLDMAVQINDNEYDLFLRVDTNTIGYTGWFYFEVKNTKRNQKAKFNILNMSKSESPYNRGMKVNFWSKRGNQSAFQGWQQGGEEIRYFRTKQLKNSEERKKLMTLSFEFTFKCDKDHVWLAYTVPYTYSMLTQYLKAIQVEQKLLKEKTDKALEDFDFDSPFLPGKQLSYKPIIEETSLCKSLGGVDVPLLTITNFKDKDWETKKKVVLIQARLHPSETGSSWIVHGIINFLIGKSKEANQLRNKLVFKIVPMANPDGVIIGNSRTTLLGKDMNRQYNQTEEDEEKLNPVPFSIKQLLAELQKQESSKIAMFYDLHQHSNRKGIFVYGPYYPLHSNNYLKVRILPKLFSETSGMFRYYSCKFRNEKYKQSCARLTIARQFNIVNTYCLECSAYGFIDEDRQTQQFRDFDLLFFGENLCHSVLVYQKIVEQNQKKRQQVEERIKKKKQGRKPKTTEILQKQQTKPVVVEEKKQEQVKEEESDYSSSQESEYSEDEDREQGIEFTNYQHLFTQSRAPPPPKKRTSLLEPTKNKEDGENFYSDEEGASGSESDEMTVKEPSDVKSLFMVSQQKPEITVSQFQQDKQVTNEKKEQKDKRTLEQLMNFIRNDVIEEESSSDASSKSSDDDELSQQDAQILRDRILHAIQVYSKYTPNPRKEILKQLQKGKLSVEQPKKQNSQYEKSVKSVEQETNKSNKGSDVGSSKSPRFKVREKQKKNIDSFLKKFGFFGKPGGGSSKKINGNESMVDKIENLDDEVLSTLSNEILKQKKKKKGIKQQDSILSIKSFAGLNQKIKEQTSRSIASKNSNLRPQSFFKGQEEPDLQYFKDQGVGTPVSSKNIQTDNQRPSSQASSRQIVLQKFLKQSPKNQQELSKISFPLALQQLERLNKEVETNQISKQTTNRFKELSQQEIVQESIAYQPIHNQKEAFKRRKEKIQIQKQQNLVSKQQSSLNSSLAVSRPMYSQKLQIAKSRQSFVVNQEFQESDEMSSTFVIAGKKLNQKQQETHTSFNTSLRHQQSKELQQQSFSNYHDEIIAKTKRKWQRLNSAHIEQKQKNHSPLRMYKELKPAIIQVEDKTDENPLYGQRGGLLLSKRKQEEEQTENFLIGSQMITERPSHRPSTSMLSNIGSQRLVKKKEQVADQPYREIRHVKRGSLGLPQRQVSSQNYSFGLQGRKEPETLSQSQLSIKLLKKDKEPVKVRKEIKKRVKMSIQANLIKEKGCQGQKLQEKAYQQQTQNQVKERRKEEALRALKEFRKLRQ